MNNETFDEYQRRFNAQYSVKGTPEYRIQDTGYPTSINVGGAATEWASIDKDMNVTFLDMDKCAEGPHNNFTVLALAVWNAAIEAAVKHLGKTDALWLAQDVIYALKELKK